MNYKLPLLIAGFILFTGLVSANYSHDTKLYFGESIEIDDYVIEYDSKRQSGEEHLQVGRWTDTSFLVLGELEGIEIYESEGQIWDVSENMSIGIESTGNDEDGRFVKLNITSKDDIFTSGELTSSAPSKIIVSQGETASISLTLSNTGYLDQNYKLRSESNSSITTSFSYQDFNVSEIQVSSGDEESITANIEVPETAELGTYNLGLIAENGEVLSENLNVEVRGAEVEKELDLNIDQSYAAAEPGGELQLYVEVRNGIGGRYVRDARPRGVTLENIEFDVTVPDGWNYELRPDSYRQLEARERQRSVLTVDVPEDAQDGDYFVDVSASSDEASIEEPEQVRVNVTERSQMGVVGLILMALSLGALIFVYRKFGRR